MAFIRLYKDSDFDACAQIVRFFISSSPLFLNLLIITSRNPIPPIQNNSHNSMTQVTASLSLHTHTISRKIHRDAHWVSNI